MSHESTALLGKTPDERFQVYVRTRDTAIIQGLIREFADRSYNQARRIIGRDDGAEDAVQDAYLRLIKQKDSDVSVPFAARIGRLVTVSALNYLRRQRSRHRNFNDREEQEVVAMNDTNDEVEARPELDAVRSALELLPERYRVPLTLHYFGGLDQQESAQALGIPPETLRTHLARGIERLRGILKRGGFAVTSAGLITLFSNLPTYAASPAFVSSLTDTHRLAAVGRQVGQGVIEAKKIASLFSGSGLLSSAVVGALAVVAALTFSARSENRSGPRIAMPAKPAGLLPFDHTNPVIYENNGSVDVYTNDYVMALASAGDIKLRGMITSTTEPPVNTLVPPGGFETTAKNEAEGVLHARNSGFRHIPDTTRGSNARLLEPESGIIEQTAPIGSEGSSLIIKEALAATPEKPLVVLAGGQLTTIADAYLRDPSISNRVIVSYIGGLTPYDMSDYGSWSDPWATYIVIQRMRLVVFSRPTWNAASVPRDRLAELPDSELRDWMIYKHDKFNDRELGTDADATIAIGLMRSDYVTEVRRMTFSHWEMTLGFAPHTDGLAPQLREDPSGSVLVVLGADKSVATEEWWRALKAPAAWGSPSVPPQPDAP
jgi:RNA polymerase sigma-70 factor (ECF subfamily)